MIGVTGVMIALKEEVMVGVGLVLTEGHQVQCIAGAQVLTMVVMAALFMIGTMGQHMIGTGVLIMVGTGVLNMADTEGNSYFQCLLMLVILFVKFCIIKTCVWSLHTRFMFSFY